MPDSLFCGCPRLAAQPRCPIITYRLSSPHSRTPPARSMRAATLKRRLRDRQAPRCRRSVPTGATVAVCTPSPAPGRQLRRRCFEQRHPGNRHRLEHGTGGAANVLSSRDLLTARKRSAAWAGVALGHLPAQSDGIPGSRPIARQSNHHPRRSHPNGRIPISGPCSQNAKSAHATTPTTSVMTSPRSVPAG